MGKGKKFGAIVGGIAGNIVSLPVLLAASATESDFLHEMYEGIVKVSMNTGALLGDVTEGTVETVKGVINEDKQLQTQGINRVLDSGATYVEGIGKGIVKIAKDGIDAVEAIVEGDSDKAMKVGKEIVKTVAVGAMAIGVADVIDGIGDFDADLDFDADDDWSEFANNEFLEEHPDMHHVTPHERVLSDGTSIWVDGDGDTTVDTFDGWYQDNPTYKG